MSKAEQSLELKFAPREAFETVLEWGVIPTFDLIIEYGDKGVVMLKRTIDPYKGVWALPGLRMMKPEGIDDTLTRVAKAELGLDIDPQKREFVGQYVGRFRTEKERQDLSTGYVIRINPDQELNPNPSHFNDLKLVTSLEEVPKRTGAMYRYYLEQYFDSK